MKDIADCDVIAEMERPPISFQEWEYVSSYARALIEAIKTTPHMQQHVGCVAFQMLLHLSTNERPGVLAYLRRVVRECSN